jgi:hypothetical protein
VSTAARPIGFTLLLVVLFAASYALGSAVDSGSGNGNGVESPAETHGMEMDR